MNIPQDLRYSKDHEWVRLEADGTATVGITEYAQNALGDIVYVELPQIGATFTAHQQAATAESVKAVSEVFTPISGTVAEVNGKLEGAPELLNKDPYGEWMFKLKDAGSEALLTPDEYAKLV
jgi:glycine cleavage system H protein